MEVNEAKIVKRAIQIAEDAFFWKEYMLVNSEL